MTTQHIMKSLNDTLRDEFADDGVNPFNVREFTENTKYGKSDEQITGLNSVVDTRTGNIRSQSIFIKHSPLLDPIKYMMGKYNTRDESFHKTPNDPKSNPKIKSQNNASFVDGLFSYVASTLDESKFKHAVGYYGSFFAVQDKFKMDITDDYSYLCESNYFKTHNGKEFAVGKPKMTKLNIANEDNAELSDVAVLDGVEIIIEAEPANGLEEVYVREVDSSDDDSDSEEEEDEEDDEEEDEEDDEEEDEETGEKRIAYINRFPVNMICLERCDGSMDELLEREEMDEQLAASALFQVVATLIVYQREFKLTHNDLHTNNIMYINTDLEFLEYTFDGRNYRVPTYGKIFKIIDFGRSIFTYKDKVWCSDSFASGGDASTQYNCEPFFNKTKPRIDPNYSFDLCRLGCSIYDFIINNETEEEIDDFQKTVCRWCLDDKQKSVLYTKSGYERYPDFKLYKMIARTVHAHTPLAQLEYPFFKQFAV
jgi:hypothetical protein